MRKNNFGNNLKALIKNSGDSQLTFAMHFGTSQSCINGYVREHHAPTLPVLCDFAEYFNVSLDELVYGDIRCEK